MAALSIAVSPVLQADDKQPTPDKLSPTPTRPPLATLMSSAPVASLPQLEYPFRRLIKEISQEANEDSCTVSPGVEFAWCYHARTKGHFDTMLTSKDTFTIDLKNGWTLDSWNFVPGAGCCIEGNGLRHDGQGQAHVTYSLNWFLPCNIGCYLYYFAQVFAEGEIGTSPW